MRGRMNDAKSYVPPFEVGKPLSGAAIGTVIASRVPEIPFGATVLHDRGWREFAVVPAKSARADRHEPRSGRDVSRRARHDRLHRLGRAAHHRRREGRRDAVRLGGGRRGRLDGGAARQALGAARDRLRELGGEGARRARGVRRRRRVRLPRRRRASTCARWRPTGSTSTSTTSAASSSKRRSRATRDLRADRAVRRDLAVQRRHAAAAARATCSLAIGRRLRLQGFIVIDHLARFREFVAEVAPLVASGELQDPDHVRRRVSRTRPARSCSCCGRTRTSARSSCASERLARSSRLRGPPGTPALRTGSMQ